MSDDFAAYAETYTRMHGLTGLSEAEARRLPALAERAILAGRGIPRVADKAYEPMTDFKAADLAGGRWAR